MLAFLSAYELQASRILPVEFDQCNVLSRVGLEGPSIVALHDLFK